ncbi:MAG: TlpA family protein disulfide reductase [Planctomycetaceae bacterium]|nr:TlpA family protein disulfide reductase [Planctomycetota bacterium]NUN53091.1 TlpA family protein disulfide reductase [Planctomycetaceae bacterium]
MSLSRALLACALLASLAGAAPLPPHLLPIAAAQDGGQGKKKDDGKKEGGKAEGGGKDEGKKEGEGKGGGKREGGGGTAGSPAAEPEKKRLAEGDEAKDLSLPLLEGGSWTPSSAAGKAAVLVFASGFSAESLEALKTLGDAKGRTAKSGAAILGVLRDADEEKARKVVKEKSLSVRIALDPKRKAYDRLARSGLPWTVILDRTGKIVHSASGFDDDAVGRKVEELSKR